MVERNTNANNAEEVCSVSSSSNRSKQQQRRQAKLMASEMRKKRLSLLSAAASNCTREEASTSTSPPLSPPIHILPPSGMVRQDSRRRSYNNSSLKVMMLKSSQVSPTFPPSLSKKRRYRNNIIRVPLALPCFFVLVALINSNGGGGKGRDLRGSTSGLEEAMMQILMTETVALPDEERERRLAVGKSIWPRCVTDRMTANQCKELIDQEILEYNTETDRFVRTIIVGKRRETDPHYNSVVLFMDDNDRVMGRDGDGIIYYDFPWVGSGNEATRYQQRKIPEIIAKEVEDVPITESIEVFIEPIRVLETDTPEGEAKLTTALAETATIEQSGQRTIGPFDCSGMTGHSCCLMIKHKVRDSDSKGRAIQCYQDYHQSTEKHKALLNARGKKVFIFENHNGKITKDPKVVGGWPQGIASDEPGFHEWIQDGGGLSVGQMKLIHGPDWTPPQDG